MTLATAIGQDLDALRIGDNVSVGQQVSAVEDHAGAAPLLGR